MNLARFSVRNPVAVNLFMWAVIIAGIYCWETLLREFFPGFEADRINITIAYPGATPEEVEKAVTRKVEQEIKDLTSIKKIESKIVESATIITVTLEDGADQDKAINDIRNRLDQVKPDLPAQAEDPIIKERRPFVPVIALIIYGQVTEEQLHRETIRIRDELLNLPDISEVFVAGLRDREIWIEVSQAKLEQFGLTFEQVGRMVAQSNLDLPGGELHQSSGNLRVRTVAEQQRATQVARIIMQAKSDGSLLRLEQIATVRACFADRVSQGRFDGQPACSITVFKGPDEDALKIAQQVKNYVATHQNLFGGALHLATITDLSRFISQRLELMIRNARAGLLLVIVSLLLFLDMRVAFWVAAGFPTAFLGTFIVMQCWGATINLISLFGLILVLGLIVDDAIVVGENVFTRMRHGMPPLEAAVQGTNEVAIPVIAAVATTIVAFLPLGFLQGNIGKMLTVLPTVVIAALSVSLLEVFLILPAHLGHRRQKTLPAQGQRWRLAARLSALRHRVLEEHLPRGFERLLKFLLHWRYVTLALMLGFSMAVIGILLGGLVPFVLLQEVDAESLSINLEMAVGTPQTRTMEVIDHLETMALSFQEVTSAFAVVGTTFSDRGPQPADDPATVAQINIELLPADERESRHLLTSQELISQLRQQSRNITGIRKLDFISHSGGPLGADIELRVCGDDLNRVAKAVAYIRGIMNTYAGITRVEDDLKLGKPELRLQLADQARCLGLTNQTLALTVRHALFGFEAQKLQEEKEEVTVRVLLPPQARRSPTDLLQLRIRTPSGARVPLAEVAQFSMVRGYSSLTRVNGQRAVTITAEVDEQRYNVARITADLTQRLANIKKRFPDVTVSFEGRKKETQDSISSLMIGFPAALLMIYMIIAMLFHSYLQPLIVMVAIPYALVGAIIGHLIMGYPFTFLSMIGGVALAGIVVNDSLILVDFINRLRQQGITTDTAVVTGAVKRLRAILLTSITTVLGLAPLMLERSFQAQFLIPMAISLVFGLLFATILTLVVIPALYLVLEDLRACLRWLCSGKWSDAKVDMN